MVQPISLPRWSKQLTTAPAGHGAKWSYSAVSTKAERDPPFVDHRLRRQFFRSDGHLRPASVRPDKQPAKGAADHFLRVRPVLQFRQLATSVRLFRLRCTSVCRLA